MIGERKRGGSREKENVTTEGPAYQTLLAFEVLGRARKASSLPLTSQLSSISDLLTRDCIYFLPNAYSRGIAQHDKGVMQQLGRYRFFSRFPFKLHHSNQFPRDKYMQSACSSSGVEDLFLSGAPASSNNGNQCDKHWGLMRWACLDKLSERWDSCWCRCDGGDGRGNYGDEELANSMQTTGCLH